jgi:hypothetical protein
LKDRAFEEYWEAKERYDKLCQNCGASNVWLSEVSVEKIYPRETIYDEEDEADAA